MNPNDTQVFDWSHRSDTDPRQHWAPAEQKNRLIQITDSDPYSCLGGSSRESLASRDRANGEWEQPSNSSQRSYGVDSDDFTPSGDPDGEPLPLNDGDEELARKKKQLELIEKQILIKKATIAIKTIEPLYQTKSAHQTFEEEREEDVSHRKADVGVENNEDARALIQEHKEDRFYSVHSAKSSDVYPHKARLTLKDRVNVILEKRRPDGFHRKSRSPIPDLAKSPSHQPKVASKRGLSSDDHPLKRRVMALMSFRRTRAYLSQSDGKVPDGKPPLLCQSSAPTNLDQDIIAKGFQRFLSVLNKGVDMNLLATIVNDDNEASHGLREHPMNIDLENESDAVDREDSRGSHSKALKRHHSRSSSLEQKTKRPDHKEDQAKTRGLSVLNDKSVRENDGGGKKSRPKSPTPEQKEMKSEQQKQQDQLQSLLTTLGLNFDPEELSSLTQRTQERLYGKKVDIRKDSTGEKDKDLQKPKSRLTFSLSNLCSVPPQQKCSPTQASSENVHTAETSSLGKSKVKRKTRWNTDQQTEVNEPCRDKEINQSLNTALAERSHEAGQAKNGQIVVGNEKSLNSGGDEGCKDLANVGITPWEKPLCHTTFTEKPPLAFSHPKSEPVMPVYHNTQYYQFTAYTSYTSTDATSLPWVHPSDCQVPATPSLFGEPPQKLQGPVDVPSQKHPHSKPAGPFMLKQEQFNLQVGPGHQQSMLKNAQLKLQAGPGHQQSMLTEEQFKLQVGPGHQQSMPKKAQLKLQVGPGHQQSMPKKAQLKLQVGPGHQQNKTSFTPGLFSDPQIKTGKRKRKKRKKKKSQANCSTEKGPVGSDTQVKIMQQQQNNKANMAAAKKKPFKKTPQKQNNKGKFSLGPKQPMGMKADLKFTELQEPQPEKIRPQQQPTKQPTAITNQAPLTAVEPAKTVEPKKLSEEEIKANFKKKLNMFNQKMKQKVEQPTKPPAVGYWESNNKNRGQRNVYAELPDHMFNFESASGSSQP